MSADRLAKRLAEQLVGGSPSAASNVSRDTLHSPVRFSSSSPSIRSKYVATNTYVVYWPVDDSETFYTERQLRKVLV